MSTNLIINEESKKHGLEILNNFYSKNIIPPEKKEYITKLENSVGAYMGIEAPNGETHFMLDAASQIATLGLGFNPIAFFGSAYHPESWTQITTSDRINTQRESFERLLKRELCWPHLATTLCHSGAEANEIALGYCFNRRVNKEAKKVLAFEGSFHGRMQISLSSTWNKSKREPFEWDDYKTTFLPFPKLTNDEIKVEYNSAWPSLWESAKKIDFKIDEKTNEIAKKDEVFKREIEILLKARTELQTKSIFAVIIEPMQCEGGDQYATDRFYCGLLSLAKAFDVPVIFDEVQTGYHLGRSFFWHKQFNLRNSLDEEIYPDYVVCAKKAQVGLVISHCDEKTHEEYSVTSFFRGAIHANALNQSKAVIQRIENHWRMRLEKFVSANSHHYSNPRGLGLAFAVDVNESSKVSEIIAKRFKFGLLYYPAGEETLRFRLNTAFTNQDIDYLFDHLSLITKEVFEQTNQEPLPIPFDSKRELQKIDNLYKWQETLVTAVLKEKYPEREKLVSLFNFKEDEELIIFNKGNFEKYSHEIVSIQKQVYEANRQTPIETFKKIIENQNSVAVGILKNKALVGINFSGPIHLFGNEKGLSDHEDFNNPKALYTADTTILPEMKGREMGRNLKYLSIILGLEKGVRVFTGRNRQVHASKMFEINLSLGAFEYKYIKNDYQDDLEFNDVIHYKIDYTNTLRNISENYSYLANSKANFSIDRKKLSMTVNKICLSNFVGKEFLENIDKILNLAPEGLRQGYSTSGQSEAVDKIVKSIWTTDRKSHRFLTFKGHFFGIGSFCARTLSNDQEPFFSVDKLDHPTPKNYKNILSQIEELLNRNKYLGVFLEPIRQKFMDQVPLNFLEELRELTIKYETPLIFNETASKFYRYSDSFYASEKLSEQPDAIMNYLGGQIGIVHINKKYFLEKPLMLISTWDGDEHSISHAVNELNNFSTENYKSAQETLNQFLTGLFQQYDLQCSQINNGTANFYGQLPIIYNQFISKIEGRNIINLSIEKMDELGKFKNV